MFLPTKYLIQRIPLPVKGVVVGLLCGLVAWVVSDFFQTPALQGILTQQLAEHLEEEAARHRVIFDRYINQHGRAIKLLAGYQPLVWWLQVGDEPAHEVRHHRRKRPPWFPPISAWRGLIDPAYLLLRDTEERLREVYHLQDRDLPAAFLDLDSLLVMRSRNQAYLSLLDGRPYLLASAPIVDSQGRNWGDVILVALLDDRFLTKVSYGTLPGGALLALLEGSDKRVIASSAPIRLPAGAALEELHDDYVVTRQPFFDYGDSDLRLQLATFLPKTDVAALNESVLVLERQQRIVIAVIFIATFTLVIFLFSERINHLLWRITTFSQRALGSKESLPKGGDRLAYLDKRINLLTDEVLSAREAMCLRYEMEHKAKQLQVLEAVTQDLGVGVALLGRDNEDGVLNQQMLGFEAQYGKEWYLGRHGEVKLQSPHRQWRIFRVSRLSLFEAGDVVLAQDITEGKRAEQILKESEEQFRSITQSANDAIVSIDSAANVVSWNEAAETTFGYSESEILGTPLTRVMPSQYRSAHAAGMHRLSSGQAPRVLGKTRELEGLRKDGTTFPIELSLSTWTVQGTRYFTGIVRDITERREKEVQLLQAQKMDVLGQLTGGIAHDFNNLLTIILGNLQFLKEVVGQEPQTRELVDDALSAARDGGELTQRLLAFSRKQTLQPKRININKLLGDLDRFLGRTLRADIALQIHQGRDVSAVLADPGQLENALLNLVINARDAMPEGGTLTIETSGQSFGPDDATTYPELVPGHYVKVRVSDTGIGMTPEHAGRAVEPFFTTKPHGQGSGLGLSMVYGFVRQSGGELRFSSELGKGTTVSMLMPAAMPASENVNRPQARGALLRGTETVLVLEDQPKVRKFAKRSLKSLGYRVLGAKNAEAAIQVLEAEPAVDLVFSDIVLPGTMNGREMARWVAENRPGLKVLLTTGFSKETDADSPADAGDFPLLKKPYSIERLAEMVRFVLDTH